MQILHDFTKQNNIVIALGYFDGIHLGHRKIIETLKQEAKTLGLKSAIVTFKSNPINHFVKNKVYNIQDTRTKHELLENEGINYLYELDFEKFKDIEAQDYILNYLIKNLNPKTIIIGFNHNFGKNKLGTPQLLENLSKTHNFKAIVVDEFKYKEETVSSTLIRNEIKKGNIQTANTLLSTSFSIENEVIKGNAIARTFNIPTANILWDENIIKPPFGVYFGEVKYENKIYKALISWSQRPTITKDNQEVLEAHLYDFNETIYDKKIRVYFQCFHRNTVKFKNIEELKNQLNRDYKKFENWIKAGN